HQRVAGALQRLQEVSLCWIESVEVKLARRPDEPRERLCRFRLAGDFRRQIALDMRQRALTSEFLAVILPDHMDRQDGAPEALPHRIGKIWRLRRERGFWQHAYSLLAKGSPELVSVIVEVIRDFRQVYSRCV